MYNDQILLNYIYVNAGEGQVDVQMSNKLQPVGQLFWPIIEGKWQVV